MVLPFLGGQLESSVKTLTFRVSAYSRDRLIGEEIDQNKNQNYSTDKVQNLGNERR